MTIQEKPGYCTLCRSRCGTIHVVEDDRLIAVKPDPTHPTGHAMCMKGKAAPELVHSPHRLLYPMKRTRPKTDADPGWTRITWEEALATTARRLSEIRAEAGAESVAFAVTTPSGTPLSDSIDWVERFVRSFGSPNTAYATEICNWHKDNAHVFTFGCGMPPADYANAQTIMLWGHNPANTWLAQADAIARGRARGARLLVIDPRPTAFATQADVWLAVRPGTDAALALGLINLLITSERFDASFVRAWTNAPFLVRRDTGEFLRASTVWADAPDERCVAWDTAANAPVIYHPHKDMGSTPLRLHGTVEVEDVRTGRTVSCEPAFACLAREAARFSPQDVERITGVAPEALSAAADLLQGGRRVAYHAWTGIGQHTNATQSERAVATLYALNGSFDRVGGNRVRKGAATQPVNALTLMDETQRAKALGLDERPLGPPASGWVMARDVYRAILEHKPYPVRAMMAFGTNMPLSHGDTGLAHAALQALEFHVHLDLFETPAARYADILLPINTPWEREGLRVGFEISDEAAGHVQLRQQMVSSRGESRSDNDIIFDLACRLGMQEAFFGGDLQAGWNHLLAPSGLTVEKLRQSPGGVSVPVDARECKHALAAEGSEAVLGFDTPTRRVELYSERLKQHGQPPVAAYVPAAEAQRLERSGERRFPLVLSSAKNGYYCHSQHRSLVSLRKRAPEPVAELSPALAAQRGIQADDWIRISTRLGSARFLARITPGLADDVVVAEFGWWQACPELDRDELPVEGRLTSNYNHLISAEDCDPVSGSVAMRSFRCDVERDPATGAQQRSWTGYRPFRIAGLAQEAEGVLGIELQPMDERPLPDFHPGQHVQIRIRPGGPDELVRAYSLTGAANDPARRAYRIAVRHQKGTAADGTPYEGRISGHVHRHMREGEVVELTAPSGTFVLPRRSPQPLVLLAGGIGITPFISLLESLPDGDPSEIRLFYANISGATHAFKDRIEAHRHRLPNLHVIDVYSNPRAEDQAGVDYVRRGRLAADVVDDSLIERRARVYMCGPPAMMDAFADDLVARGMLKFDMFREVFRSPPGPIVDDGRTFEVRFGRSDATGTWAAKEGPLLQFGESLGLALPSGCRVGQCESCAVRIVSGSVRHLHGVEPEEEDVCLTCQAVPVDDLVLDA